MLLWFPTILFTGEVNPAPIHIDCARPVLQDIGGDGSDERLATKCDRLEGRL
jgi:hypothetical protein